VLLCGDLAAGELLVQRRLDRPDALAGALGPHVFQ